MKTNSRLAVITSTHIIVYDGCDDIAIFKLEEGQEVDALDVEAVRIAPYIPMLPDEA